MIIDYVDILILKEFNKLNGKSTTLWSLMKKIYPEGRNREYMEIKRKIIKMSNEGLFFIDDNNGRHYQLLKDNVKFKNVNFPGRKTNSICLKTCGKWWAFEL